MGWQDCLVDPDRDRHKALVDLMEVLEDYPEVLVDFELRTSGKHNKTIKRLDKRINK